MLSRFYLIPERMDKQTDGRTDGRTDLLYQYRASVCWRAIKTGMAWLPDGEKISTISLFVLIECTNVTDTHTHTHTHNHTHLHTHTQHDGIGRACIASRGKIINAASVASRYVSVPLRQLSADIIKILTAQVCFLFLTAVTICIILSKSKIIYLTS